MIEGPKLAKDSQNIRKEFEDFGFLSILVGIPKKFLDFLAPEIQKYFQIFSIGSDRSFGADSDRKLDRNFDPEVDRNFDADSDLLRHLVFKFLINASLKNSGDFGNLLEIFDFLNQILEMDEK